MNRSHWVSESNAKPDEGGSAEVNKRHPNVFGGMCAPQLVIIIRNRKVNMKPFIS